MIRWALRQPSLRLVATLKGRGRRMGRRDRNPGGGRTRPRNRQLTGEPWSPNRSCTPRQVPSALRVNFPSLLLESSLNSLRVGPGGQSLSSDEYETTCRGPGALPAPPSPAVCPGLWPLVLQARKMGVAFQQTFGHAVNMEPHSLPIISYTSDSPQNLRLQLLLPSPELCPERVVVN